MLQVFLDKGSLKHRVVQCLAQKWPLSQKEIHSFCSLDSAASFQAVHKAVHELVDSGVVEKTDGGLFRLSLEHARRMALLWESILGAYEKERPKSRIFIGGQVIPTSHKYDFADYDLSIEGIPSLLVSKSTLHRCIELMTSEQLDSLAEHISLKNFRFIQERLLSESERSDPLKYLEKLNEQAVVFYWGRIEFEARDEVLVLKIFSNSFTSEKEKKFYDLIYLHFLGLLGYKLQSRDELAKHFVFKKVPEWNLSKLDTKTLPTY